MFESIERHPVTYLPTGDLGLLMAWYVGSDGFPSAVLCLEDGRAVAAPIDQFKFDYRYSVTEDKWFDVSKIHEGEDPDVDTDQEAGDDGRSPVPGLVPDTD